MSENYQAIEEAKKAAEIAARDEFTHGSGIMEKCVASALDAFLGSLKFQGCKISPPEPKCGCKTEWTFSGANITICEHHMKQMAKWQTVSQ